MKGEWRRVKLRGKRNRGSLGDMDYLRYYDRESYLLEHVGPMFRAGQGLSSFDFFTIVAWKSERAKPRMARLLQRAASTASLDDAVRQFSAELRGASDSRGRLHVVNEEWKIRLPMASAILSVLYPEEFTVFDIRVSGELGMSPSLPDRAWPGRAEGYWQFVDRVREQVPEAASLRDKDRILWARSVAKQLRDDIRRWCDSM